MSAAHNFDPRSQDLNTETILIINDAATAGAIEDDILRDIEPQNSWVVGPRAVSPVVGFLAFLPDRVLSTALGIQKGDAYNAKQLEQNLHGNRRSSDVSSLYMNRGYMLFRAQPEVRVVEGGILLVEALEKA